MRVFNKGFEGFGGLQGSGFRAGWISWSRGLPSSGRA